MAGTWGGELQEIQLVPNLLHRTQAEPQVPAYLAVFQLCEVGFHMWVVGGGHTLVLSGNCITYLPTLEQNKGHFMEIGTWLGLKLTLAHSPVVPPPLGCALHS